MPDKINWPKVSLPDHYGVVADKVNSALNAANAEIGDLKSKLEIQLKPKIGSQGKTVAIFRFRVCTDRLFPGVTCRTSPA